MDKPKIYFIKGGILGWRIEGCNINLGFNSWEEAFKFLKIYYKLYKYGATSLISYYRRYWA